MPVVVVRGVVVQLKNVHSGLCIAVHGQADGNRPFMTTCGDFADQDWPTRNW